MTKYKRKSKKCCTESINGERHMWKGNLHESTNGERHMYKWKKNSHESTNWKRQRWKGNLHESNGRGRGATSVQKRETTGLVSLSKIPTQSNITNDQYASISS